jgi:uncharacterized protein YozE (UPF0346 family)
MVAAGSVCGRIEAAATAEFKTMTNSFTPAQVERFRREAKKLSRDTSITHSEALDQIAAQQGFANWSLLAKHSTIKSAITKLPIAAPGVRHYLHGDLAENDPDRYYCARCDVFFEASHFQPESWHGDDEDGERFLKSLERWSNLRPSERGNRYRPLNASNILQKAAEGARAARESSRSPFHLWLERQRGRNDPVGDLASDVLSDKSFPLGASTRREIEDYLGWHGDHVIRAVRQAWREYQK